VQSNRRTSTSAYFNFVSSLLSTATTGEFGRNKRDFSRGGPLTPDFLVTFLLFMVADANRRGYRHLIDAFWDEAQSFDLDLPCDEPVSSAALCKARQKLAPELLRDLLHQASETFDEQFGSDKRWFGRRVFGVDGTKSGVLGLAAYVLRLLLACDADQAAPFLDRVLKRIVRTKDPKRPGRHWPRRSFKPAPKWRPTGRRGG
jgi:hypothetical protein